MTQRGSNSTSWDPMDRGPKGTILSRLRAGDLLLDDPCTLKGVLILQSGLQETLPKLSIGSECKSLYALLTERQPLLSFLQIQVAS